jgi:exo-beta-1,3-glucanase (GH17 family)
MHDNGDDAKPIWATEFGAPTAGNSYAVGEAAQANEITQAFSLLSSQTWGGPIFVYTYRLDWEDPTDSEAWFGIVNADFSPRPAYQAYKASSAAAQ